MKKSLKELPIGRSSLDNIINNNCVYVDKTRFVVDLVNSGVYYFLSRPRRFGKSLFLDTLKQAFLGNRAIFSGLYLDNHWDWSIEYPVIHISFASEVHDVKSLEQNMHNILDRIIRHYELDHLLAEKLLNNKLLLLIETLSLKSNKQVVILVDEYDKPVLDNIENLEDASFARGLLKSLYSVIKDCDAYLKFVFVTGVTKFAKAGIFSNLNNLNDITLDAHYADICGYTQHDIETTFADYLPDVNLPELKRWYNGYNFLGNESQKVYNPFDILLFIDKGNKYNNYWFETGTPTFLIQLLQQKCYYLPNVEGLQITSSALGSFDIDNLLIEVLLLQTGYLTIKSAEMDSMMGIMLYTLDYPNFEVRQSLNDTVFTSLFKGDNSAISNKFRMRDALQVNDFDGLKTIFSSLLASIPHDWYRNNQIARYEGFYCSIIYSFFNAMGLTAIPEDNTNLGQIDLTIILADKILIIEFKMRANDNAMHALEQIKAKQYHTKYLGQGKPMYLIAIVFDAEARNICDYAWECVAP